MKINSIFYMVCLIFSACDTLEIARRVQADSSVEIIDQRSKKRIHADVYLSRDKLVELHVFGSTGINHIDLDAYVFNKRTTPIQIDLSSVYQVKKGKKIYRQRMAFYDGCEWIEPPQMQLCKINIFEVPSGQKKRVMWGDVDTGEFHMPIISFQGWEDEVVVRLEK